MSDRSIKGKADLRRYDDAASQLARQSPRGSRAISRRPTESFVKIIFSAFVVIGDVVMVWPGDGGDPRRAGVTLRRRLGLGDVGVFV